MGPLRPAALVPAHLDTDETCGSCAAPVAYLSRPSFFSFQIYYEDPPRGAQWKPIGSVG